MSSAVRRSAQEPTEGIALSQREPVGILVIYGGEDVNEHHSKMGAY